jgi:hypothetical protein
MAVALAVGCGQPHSAPPVGEREPAPAPVPPVVVDAAPPPDAAPDAPPDATPVACWDEEPTAQIVEVLRVRVRDTGDETLSHGAESWSVQWADADIVEVIRGDMTRVDKRFRTSVYAITETHYCKKGAGCGERPPDAPVEELIAAKGEERVVVIALPPQGAEWNGIPARLRKKYGKREPMLLEVCP